MSPEREFEGFWEAFQLTARGILCAGLCAGRLLGGVRGADRGKVRY